MAEQVFSCPLSERHLWTALKYVEENPVRAGLSSRVSEYRWSSALAHLTGDDPSGILDLAFWLAHGGRQGWQVPLAKPDGEIRFRLLRRCTYAGRPFGDGGFLAEMEERFHRKWRRWAFEQSLFPHPQQAVMG